MIIYFTSRAPNFNPMSEALVQKNVYIKRVLTVDQKTAQALSDSVRTRILDALSHKPMSAEEVTKVLGAAGAKKAVTTVRHHLEILKTCGLIETTKIIEIRGAVLKYYAPTVRAFSNGGPGRIEETQAKLIQDTAQKLLRILRGIHADKKFQAEVEKNNVTCSMCKGSHYREYAAVEIVNLALAKAMGAGDYVDMTTPPREPKAQSAKS